MQISYKKLGLGLANVKYIFIVGIKMLNTSVIHVPMHLCVLFHFESLDKNCFNTGKSVSDTKKLFLAGSLSSLAKINKNCQFCSFNSYILSYSG